MEPASAASMCADGGATRAAARQGSSEAALRPKGNPSAAPVPHSAPANFLDASSLSTAARRIDAYAGTPARVTR